MRPDHYTLLGVEPEASAADIRAAYLRQMRVHHPDRNPSPESVERAKAIIAAFKVLSDFDQRSYYDWDRRRERERAVALTAVPDRALDKKAAVVGTAGAVLVVAAMAGWSFMFSTSDRPIETARADRPSPPPAAIDPDDDQAAAPGGGRDETVIRIRPALPERAVAARAAEARAMERVVEDGPPRPVAKPVAARPVARLAAAAPTPRPMATVAEPSPQSRRSPARPSGEIASLDQFVMGFYGQSWRYGDAPKRAVLERTRASFVARRGACTGDSCRRNAYLDLMRDVSSIVETGKPEGG